MPKRKEPRGVEHVLERGAVTRPGEWKPAHRAYNYAVAGTDVEGSSLHVVVSVDEPGFLLILVTAF